MTLEELYGIDGRVFLWGCQGPDILFYHIPLPQYRKYSLAPYGNALHDDPPAAIFRAMTKVCSYLLSTNHPLGEPVLAYSIGFCCHYCYDRRLHPLVYYLTEQLEKSDPRGKSYKFHSEIESNMDAILLRNFSNRSISQISADDILPRKKGDDIDATVACFYTLMIMELYGRQISSRSVASLADNFHSELGMLLHDRYSIKRPLIAAVERCLPSVREGTLSGLIHPNVEDMTFDYGNLNRNEWFNPDDPNQRSRMNLHELTDAAMTDTLTLMGCFVRALTKGDFSGMNAFLGNINFEGRRAGDN